MIAMFYSYKELLKKYKSDYQIKKAVQKKEVFKIKPGIYSDDKSEDVFAELFITRKDAILTLQSAFHFHNVTDYVPEFIYVATPRSAYPISIQDVKQVFISNKYHLIGVSEIKEEGYTMRVYDLERTLIELIRYETKIPFEEYHHVLKKFREIKNKLDFNTLMKYAKMFKSYKKIVLIVQNSIM